MLCQCDNVNVADPEVKLIRVDHKASYIKIHKALLYALLYRPASVAPRSLLRTISSPAKRAQTPSGHTVDFSRRIRSLFFLVDVPCFAEKHTRNGLLLANNWHNPVNPSLAARTRFLDSFPPSSNP